MYQGVTLYLPPLLKKGQDCLLWLSFSGVMKFEEENVRLDKEIKALHKWVMASGLMSVHPQWPHPPWNFTYDYPTTRLMIVRQQHCRRDVPKPWLYAEELEQLCRFTGSFWPGARKRNKNNRGNYQNLGDWINLLIGFHRYPVSSLRLEATTWAFMRFDEISLRYDSDS